MMTVHKLSAGDGYRYYSNEVATGDQLRSAERELGDYYTVEGMPPGQWYGEGIGHLGVSGEVTETQMHALFGDADQPMSEEQKREAFAVSHGAYTNAHAATLEDHRLEAAAKAWPLIQQYRSGATQVELAQSLGISQQSVSKRLDQYEQAGNDLTREKNLPEGQNMPTEREFLAAYTMTGPETQRAQAAAEKAGKTAAGDWLKTVGLGARPKQYKPTAFMLGLASEVARHERTQGDSPTPEELKKIRNRVGAVTFREAHGRDPQAMELVKFIAEESKPKQQTVAGFDLVFTPTKSVSMVWGLGDEQLRTAIESAHERAVADAKNYLQANATYTRRGRNGIQQIDVDGGLIATKFRHYDNREGDPNIHDHVVVANRVKGVDGKWATLDARMIYQYGVAASEVYNASIIRHVSDATGLEFTAREVRGQSVHELAGITQEQIGAFSSRREQINTVLDRLTTEFTERTGHEPTQKQRIKLAQQATLETRPAKAGPHSLAELNTLWQEKAQQLFPDLPVGERLTPYLQQATEQAREQAAAQQQKASRERVGLAENAVADARATDPELSPEAAQAIYASHARGPEQYTPAEHAQAIISTLEESRASWRESNIDAAATRYFKDTLGADVDPDTVAATRAAVKTESVAMTPELTVSMPAELVREDGTSIYTTANSTLYTSPGIIAAEQRILTAATQLEVIPLASHEAFEETLAAHTGPLSPAQAELAREFVTSEKLLTVGIGAAGAGKTSTSMKLAVDTVQNTGGQVIGLAPTAAAAAVMSKDLDIEATTVDSMFFASGAEHIESLKPGDMILVDEAGMITTPKLSRLLDIAESQGAVVRAIGDDKQLAAIGAGGALRLIDQQAGAIHLEEVHRFRNPDGTLNQAEAEASLALREPPVIGEDRPFDWYESQGRVVSGEHEVMAGQVFTHWVTDTEQGMNSIMLGADNATVTHLNELAQARATQLGQLDPSSSLVNHAGVTMHPGDTVLTRKNNRQLSTNQGKDFVKNGDTWTLKTIHDDGSVKLKHNQHHGTVTLPAWYVGENLELGYASTINRAQGSTVDSVHAIATDAVDRAGAYVALSRGRYENRLYVGLNEGATRAEVLETIAGAYDRDLSVHEQASVLREQNRSVSERLAYYDDLTLKAQERAMAEVAREALGETRGNQIAAAPAWPALAHELAEADANGLDPAALLTRAHDQRGFADSQDDAAVLHWRVQSHRSANDELLERTGPRPLAGISDEHLAKLIERTETTMADSKNRELEDPGWAKRPYGMVPTEQLNARRTGLAETMRDHDKAEYRWTMAEMDAEASRRRWSSPTQRQVEEIARGERPRTQDATYTLRNALRQEQELRAHLLPTHERAEQDPARITHGVSGHTAGTYWLTHEHTPAAYRQILTEHHQDIGDLTRLRGVQLAAERPAWVEALGEVPANTRNAEQWYRVAGEVEAYRAQYNLTAAEPVAIPKDYRESERGQYLQAQITDVHKRSELSHRPGPNTGQRLTAAAEATAQRQATEIQTPAEQKIATPVNERTQAVENLWDNVETAYAAERAALAEQQAAAERIEAARAQAAEATAERDRIADHLVTTAHADYRPVDQAADRVEEANLFTRGRRENEYEEALAEYQAKHDRTTVPERSDDQWLRRDPDYAAAEDRAQRAENDVAAEQPAYEQATARAGEAAQAREDAYATYATAREENPDTRVATLKMSPEQAQQRRTMQATRDAGYLSQGVRPGHVRENNRKMAKDFKTSTAKKSSAPDQHQKNAAQRQQQVQTPNSRKL